MTAAYLEAISLKEAEPSCLSRKGNRQELWRASMHSCTLPASLKASLSRLDSLVLASDCCCLVSTAGKALIASAFVNTHTGGCSECKQAMYTPLLEDCTQIDLTSCLSRARTMHASITNTVTACKQAANMLHVHDPALLSTSLLRFCSQQTHLRPTLQEAESTCAFYNHLFQNLGQMSTGNT